MSAVAETLLEENKKVLCDKIKQIPMSALPATKKSEILTQDELTRPDVMCDNAVLFVLVRFLTQTRKCSAMTCKVSLLFRPVQNEKTTRLTNKHLHVCMRMTLTVQVRVYNPGRTS